MQSCHIDEKFCLLIHVQGLLLDIGRNPLLFPCAWIRRQGVLTPWKRNRLLKMYYDLIEIILYMELTDSTNSRLPNLEGDNWWKGHAAAFLRYSKLPPEALRKGRVCQVQCLITELCIYIRENAQFLVVSKRKLIDVLSITHVWKYALKVWYV